MTGALSFPLFITNATNIRYLTGFVGVESRDAYLLLLETKAFLLVSPLYEEEAKKVLLQNSYLTHHFPTIKALDVNILTPDNRIGRQLQTICEKEGIEDLQFESDNLSVSEYDAYQKFLPSLILTPTQNIIEALRMKKFPQEIASITNAAKLTDDCFTYIQTKIKKGVTESELAWDIETFFRNAGAQLAFSPIVAFGPNSALPHYSPVGQGSTLSENDIILFDFGARVDGYCADMTRMIFVGTPKKEWLDAYQAVLDAQTTALTSITTTCSGKSADQAARDVLEKTNLPLYPHSLGHGVGLDIHETPRLTIHQDNKLVAGMIITVEPATYIAGDFGIRIEDLLYISETKTEVLSKSTKDVIILSL